MWEWTSEDRKLFEFRWIRFAAGFKIVGQKKARILLLNRVGQAFESYVPPVVLFRDFSAVALSEEGVLQFANQWGPLTLSEKMEGQIEHLLALDQFHFEKHMGVFVQEEPVSVWIDEIRFMKAAVRLWDAVKHNEKQFLDESLEWTSGRSLSTVRTRPGSELESLGDGLTGLFGMPNLKCGAWSLLEQAANERLQRHPLTYHVRASFARDQPLPMIFKMRAQNLIGALWQQFAESLCADKEYRRCLSCGELMEISLIPTGYRTNRKYCSDACRQRACRQRKGPSRNEETQ